MLIPVLLALLATILLGALLIVLGIRGKRLNDHPTCRWCGFDLENIYPAGVTCPECGAGLKREKAVRIGQRRRRPLFVIVGVLFALLPLAPIGTVAFASITGTNITQYKPLGLLLWECRYADAKASKAIADEFMNRMTANALDPDQEAKVVALALARQENADLPWDEIWGDLIERARLNGRLSKEEQQRFLRNAVVPRLKVRPQVAEGDSVPIEITTELRIGTGTQAMVYLWLDDATVGEVELNRHVPGQRTGFYIGAMGSEGGPLATAWAMGSKSNMFGGRSIMPSKSLVEFKPALTLKPGKHEINLTLQVVGSNWDTSGRALLSANIKPKPNSTKARKWDLKLPLEVVPKEAGAIAKVAPTPELTEELMQLLTPSQVMRMPTGLGGRMVNMNFSISDLPVPVAFDVYCRSGDKTVKVGSFTSATSSTTEFYGVQDEHARRIYGPLTGLKGSKMDVILKPSTQLASGTVDLTKIYDGELVFEDVEVQKIPDYSTTVQQADSEEGADDTTDADNPSEKPEVAKPKPKKSSSSWSWGSLLPW